MAITLTGSFLMIFAHLLSLMIPDCHQCAISVVPLVILGISYTTYAVVLWGSLPYMVEAHTLGSAFGICTTFQNIGTLISPIIISAITGDTENEDEDPNTQIKNYAWLQFFFIFVSIIAFVCNFIIYLWDKKKRMNILQARDPLELFERYTTMRQTQKQKIRGKSGS